MANTIKEDTGNEGQLALPLVVTKCACKHPVYVHPEDVAVDPYQGLTRCCGEDWELLG